MEVRKAELLCWVAHARYLNRICNDELLQSSMLSAYGASLSSTPTPKEVFQAFDMELVEPDVAAPRLLSCLRAAQRRQGDAVDLALCFVALSRAVRLRARMVRSFNLESETTIAAQLKPKTRALWRKLVWDVGMPESKAISLVLQVEALEEKGEHVLQAILPYACMMPMGPKKIQSLSAVVPCWAECYDEKTGSWCGVDPTGPFFSTNPANLFVQSRQVWTLALDALGTVEDATDRYDAAPRPLLNWESLQPWWLQVLQKVSEPEPLPIEPPATPKRVKGKFRGVKRNPMAKIEPFKENLQELQSFIERRGAPWHKSDDPEERRMALFVRHLLSLKKKLPAGKLRLMKRLCPLWKEVDRRTEVRAAAEPEPVVPSKEEATRFSFVQASLQLARCRTVQERRQLLRKLQVEFHPDKNPDGSTRPMFDFVQSQWNKEFRQP